MKRLFMDNPISNSFGTLDTVILAGYFILLISLGILFSRHKSTSQDYFLAGRSIPVWAAGISFMATALSDIMENHGMGLMMSFIPPMPMWIIP